MAIVFCADCACEKEAVPIYKAMSLVGVSRRTIYNWVEKGWVHCTHLPNGRRMVCRDSLVGRAGANGRPGNGAATS
jgi:predicted site-specific integrase-resolvase